MEKIRIMETTQAEFAGMLIGAGNVFEEEFTDENGATGRALHASLFIEELVTQEELDIRTRAGQVIEFAGKRILVTEITNSETNRGSVSLCRVDVL